MTLSIRYPYRSQVPTANQPVLIHDIWNAAVRLVGLLERNRTFAAGTPSEQ
jgi:hypothetical protein